MNKALQQLINWIVPLALGALLFWVFSPAPGTNEKDVIKRENARRQKSIDSLLEIEKVLVKRDCTWTLLHRADLEALDRAHSKTKTWQKKYEDVKNAPVVRYNEHQLDSAIDALIARHNLNRQP